MLGPVAFLERLQALGHHGIAVFRRDINAGRTHGAALVEASQLVQRLGENVVGRRVGRLDGDALPERIDGVLITAIVEVVIPMSEPRYIVVRARKMGPVLDFARRCGCGLFLVFYRFRRFSRLRVS